MAELIVRLVFSLAVVLGLLLLCARLAGRRFQGRRDAMVQIVHRQPISRNASVSVVNVGGRVLVLGTTDQEVRLLTELDPAALAETDDGTDDKTDDGTGAEPPTGNDARRPLALVTHIDAAESVRTQRLELSAERPAERRAEPPVDHIAELPLELSAAGLLLRAQAQQALEQALTQQRPQERAPDPESRYEFRPGRHLAARTRPPARADVARTAATRTQPSRGQAARSQAARTQAARAQTARAQTARARLAEQPGALSGSLLSVRTWRQAWGAVTGHAS